MQTHIVLKPGAVTGVTVSNTTTGLTTPHTETVGAIITVETSDVRMRWDGVSPASGAGGGQLMKKDSVWEVTGRDLLVAMRFYAETADAYVSCSELKGY
jgi:hypothetical protein